MRYEYTLKINDTTYNPADMARVVNSESMEIKTVLCNTAYKSGVNTLTFGIRPRNRHLFNTIYTAIQEKKTSTITVVDTLDNNKVVFRGLVNMNSVEMRSSDRNEGLTINCVDRSSYLDTVVTDDFVMEGANKSDCVRALLTRAESTTGQTLTLLSSLLNTNLEYFVVRSSDKKTYREYIDTLLYESGGYVLIYDMAADGFRIVKVERTTPVRTVTAYLIQDKLTTKSIIYDHDGVTLGYQIVKSKDNVNLYTEGINISVTSEGKVVGQDIPKGHYFPATGSTIPTYQAYTTEGLDREFLTGIKATKNQDLKLLFAKNITVNIQCDKQLTNPPAIPAIGWTGQNQFYPDKAWCLYINNNNPTSYKLSEDVLASVDKDYYRKEGNVYTHIQNVQPTDTPKANGWYEGIGANLTSFELQGTAIYVSQVQEVTTPANAKNPEPYQSTFIFNETDAKNFNKWIYNIKVCSGTTSEWTANENEYAIGEVVGVQQKDTAVIMPHIIVQKTAYSLDKLGELRREKIVAVNLYDWTEYPTYGSYNILPGASITIDKITPEYYLSDTIDYPSGGEWTETKPAEEEGKYLYNRTATYYSNGLIIYSEPYYQFKVEDSTKLEIVGTEYTYSDSPTDVVNPPTEDVYFPTTDTEPQQGKTYYTYDSETGEYTEFTGSAFEEGITYYEKITQTKFFTDLSNWTRNRYVWARQKITYEDGTTTYGTPYYDDVTTEALVRSTRFKINLNKYTYERDLRDIYGSDTISYTLDIQGYGNIQVVPTTTAAEITIRPTGNNEGIITIPHTYTEDVNLIITYEYRQGATVVDYATITGFGVSSQPKYWGMINSLPEGNIITGDYFLPSETFAESGVTYQAFIPYVYTQLGWQKANQSTAYENYAQIMYVCAKDLFNNAKTNFVATSDSEYVPGKAYYILNTTTTPPTYELFAGTVFVEGVTYYELKTNIPAETLEFYNYNKNIIAEYIAAVDIQLVNDQSTLGKIRSAGYEKGTVSKIFNGEISRDVVNPGFYGDAGGHFEAFQAYLLDAYIYNATIIDANVTGNLHAVTFETIPKEEDPIRHRSKDIVNAGSFYFNGSDAFNAVRNAVGSYIYPFISNFFGQSKTFVFAFLTSENPKVRYNPTIGIENKLVLIAGNRTGYQYEKISNNTVLETGTISKYEWINDDSITFSTDNRVKIAQLNQSVEFKCCGTYGVNIATKTVYRLSDYTPINLQGITIPETATNLNCIDSVASDAVCLYYTNNGVTYIYDGHVSGGAPDFYIRRTYTVNYQARVVICLNTLFVLPAIDLENDSSNFDVYVGGSEYNNLELCTGLAAESEYTTCLYSNVVYKVSSVTYSHADFNYYLLRQIRGTHNKLQVFRSSNGKDWELAFETTKDVKYSDLILAYCENFFLSFGLRLLSETEHNNNNWDYYDTIFQSEDGGNWALSNANAPIMMWKYDAKRKGLLKWYSGCNSFLYNSDEVDNPQSRDPETFLRIRKISFNNNVFSDVILTNFPYHSDYPVSIAMSKDGFIYYSYVHRIDIIDGNRLVCKNSFPEEITTYYQYCYPYTEDGLWLIGDRGDSDIFIKKDTPYYVTAAAPYWIKTPDGEQTIFNTNNVSDRYYPYNGIEKFNGVTWEDVLQAVYSKLTSGTLTFRAFGAAQDTIISNLTKMYINPNNVTVWYGINQKILIDKNTIFKTLSLEFYPIAKLKGNYTDTLHPIESPDNRQAEINIGTNENYFDRIYVYDKPPLELGLETNLNTLLITGSFYGDASTGSFQNCPINNGTFTLDVKKTGINYIQILTTENFIEYNREYRNNQWSSWGIGRFTPFAKEGTGDISTHIYGSVNISCFSSTHCHLTISVGADSSGGDEDFSYLPIETIKNLLSLTSLTPVYCADNDYLVSGTWFRSNTFNTGSGRVNGFNGTYFVPSRIVTRGYPIYGGQPLSDFNNQHLIMEGILCTYGV